MSMRSWNRYNTCLAFGGLMLAVAAAPRASKAGPETLPQARGVLRSVGEATLSSDISAHILRIPFREGDTFKKGDVLVAFDCARHQAELKVAEAEFRSQRATYENGLSLLKMKAAGALEVAVAKGQSDKAEANVQVAQVRVAQCQILAPFAGRVVDVLGHEHDTPAPNAPLLRIVDHANIEVDLILPSKWLGWLRAGTPFTFQIDETGTTVPGRVIRLGAAVDPVSQTLKINGVLQPAEAGPVAILPGMSGNATFKGPAE